MKRRLTQIALFLVLGAIVNVAVAWVGCRWIPVDPVVARTIVPPGGLIQMYSVDELPPRGGVFVAQIADVEWLNMTQAQIAPANSYSRVEFEPIARSTLVDYDRFRYTDESVDATLASFFPIGRYFAVRVRAGWPMKSLCGGIADRRVIAGEPVGDPDTGIIAKATDLPLLIGGSRVTAFTLGQSVPASTGQFGLILPYRPLWPGFAINTVFYAGILWGLLAVPFALRRWRRIRRGLCPKCAYDLRGRPPKDAEKCPECGSIVAS